MYRNSTIVGGFPIPVRGPNEHGLRIPFVSSTGNRTCVNRVVYCATGTEIYISPG
jgi:hypothetical protein